jgi:hypothetical protein
VYVHGRVVTASGPRAGDTSYRNNRTLELSADPPRSENRAGGLGLPRRPRGSDREHINRPRDPLPSPYSAPHVIHCTAAAPCVNKSAARNRCRCAATVTSNSSTLGMGSRRGAPLEVAKVNPGAEGACNRLACDQSLVRAHLRCGSRSSRGPATPRDKLW